MFPLCFWFAISNVTVSRAEQRQLGQVVYITVSKACGCMLELCQAGEIIVGNVFSGERKRLQAPALLFLDTQGKLLWMAVGELSENDIQEKLRVLGN